MTVLSDFDRGFLVGVLVGEGSFGGDGKQPQVTLRCHVRRETLVRRLVELLPSSKLYGPYHHGDRSYFQWMARGRGLVREVLPLLDAVDLEALDGHAAERYREMCDRYASVIARHRSAPE